MLGLRDEAGLDVSSWGLPIAIPTSEKIKKKYMYGG